MITLLPALCTPTYWLAAVWTGEACESLAKEPDATGNAVFNNQFQHSIFSIEISCNTIACSINITITNIYLQAASIRIIKMFKKVVREAKFKNHLKGFQLDVQQIEYRKDPLLNRWCRINVFRAQRRKESIACPDISELIESSAKKCYFCPERIQTQTPMFAEEIALEGRIKVGESAVFPNLNPFAQYHAVATITEKHYLRLGEFTEKQIQDAISASLEYIKRVNKHDGKAKFPTLNWNYLPPSGASIVHPHVQITVDAQPTYLVDFMLKASKRYYRKHKENFWHRLLAMELGIGERFIASIGGIAWLASFAPLGNNEVSIIFKDIASIVELTPELIQDFASGLRKVLYAYSQYFGVESFNLCFYSAPINGSEGYCLNAKLISRPRLNYYYTNDAGFMERLHSEVVVESSPEAVAKEMRQFFGASYLSVK